MIRHSLPKTGSEEADAVAVVVRSGKIAQGAEVEAFEREVAEFSGRKFGIAVSNGTAGLHLSVGTLGAGLGLSSTTCAVPVYACASLVTATGMQGVRAHLVDISEHFNVDIKQIPHDADISIVPHLFGAKAALPTTGMVIEDIAQSIGGDTGKRSPIAVASFYATKLMTTGEGGMVLTDDESIAEYIRDRRDYDNRDTFVQRFAYKMTDMQAAMGRVQLRRLPSFIARRREIASRFTEAFASLPLELPGGAGHVYFRYVVLTPEREALEAHLNASGVEAKRPVYKPAHHYFDGEERGTDVVLEDRYPVADRAHEEALSIPIHPSLSDVDVDTIINSVTEYFEKRG